MQDDTLTPMRILIGVSAIMSYMIFVCFIGVFSAKILGYYEFYQGNTSASTLLNSAFYILKFTPPICFNLLDISLGQSKVLKQSAFYNSIGDLQIVPLLGLNLPKVFANLLIIVVLFFMCGVHKRVKKALGYPVYEFSTRLNNLMVIEGKRIIETERKVLLEDLELKNLDVNETLVCFRSPQMPARYTLRQTELDRKMTDFPSFKDTLMEMDREFFEEVDLDLNSEANLD